MHPVTNKSPVSHIPRERRKANVMLFSAFILFLVGIFAPVLTFKKFFIFSSKVSIITGQLELLSEGYPVLFILIFVFSILLPFFKFFMLFGLVNGVIRNPNKHAKILRWVAHYGKWSMLDVFVAALLIVTIRLGTMADVEVHFGLYAFAGAVILTMVTTSKVLKLTDP